MSGPGLNQQAEDADKSNSSSQPIPARKPTELKTIEEFNEFLKTNYERLTIILIIQDWAENCASTYNVVVELANEPRFERVAFAEVVAEEHPDICSMLGIMGVPSVLFFRKHKELDRVVGVRVRDVVEKMTFHLQNNTSPTGTTTTTRLIPAPKKMLNSNAEIKKAELNQRLKALIESSKVMVFMKGTPDEPKCGFSRTLIGILRETGVSFLTFNILRDEDVREGLKEYSNWRTYPQVYVDGQLIGGLDIIKELKANDELESTLKGEC